MKQEAKGSLDRIGIKNWEEEILGAVKGYRVYNVFNYSNFLLTRLVHNVPNQRGAPSISTRPVRGCVSTDGAWLADVLYGLVSNDEGSDR